MKSCPDMPMLTDITGLSSSVIAMTAAIILMAEAARMPKPGLAMLTSATAIAALVPIAGLSPAAYLRGVIGDLSITTLVLLVLAILKPPFRQRPTAAKAYFTLQILIASAALVLYPMALGMGYFDTYRLGYGNLWLVIVLLVVALVACFKQFPVIALSIALAVFAWGIGWYESNNLWDYLIDPLVSIHAISAVMGHGVRALRKPKRRSFAD